jgi:orotate phosphoribosyltransferase
MPHCELIINKNSAWEELRQKIVTQTIHLKENISFDFRLLLTDPKASRQAGYLLWQMIRPFGPNVLIGPGFGAAPLLFATASAALDEGVHLAILMVRDQRKSHNQKKWVEGKRQPDHSRAVMIDDFMQSGSALPLVKQALQADGHVLKLVAVALFFDMWEPHGSRQISTSRVPVVSLFKRHDIGLTRDCYDAKAPDMQGSHARFIDPEPIWWRFNLNTKKEYPLKSTPTISMGSVFVADDHCRVWRFDALNGEVQWRYDSLANPLKGIVQHLQVLDESIVVACYDGTLTRLAAGDGSIQWRWRLDSSIHATPEIDIPSQRVFINTEQWNDGSPFGHLMALDWSTGEVLWRHAHPWWPPGSPVYSAQANIVVATCNDQSVVALSATDGRLVWRHQTRGLVRGKPAIHSNCVLLATEAGWIHCFDLYTGDLRWESRYGQGNMHQFLHVRGDTVFTLDGRWHLVAFHVKTGEIFWVSRLRSPGNWCPVAWGQYLVVLSREGHLAVFDAQRHLKVWEGSVGIRSRCPPGIGRCGKDILLAVAGQHDGLQTYRIHPEYTPDS